MALGAAAGGGLTLVLFLRPELAASRSFDSCLLRRYRLRRVERFGYMFVMDLGSGKLRILERKSGKEVGSFGRRGPNAGEFRYAHTIAVDSKDNVYVAETASGRRIQKFTRTN